MSLSMGTGGGRADPCVGNVRGIAVAGSGPSLGSFQFPPAQEGGDGAIGWKGALMGGPSRAAGTLTMKGHGWSQGRCYSPIRGLEPGHGLPVH